MSSVFGPICLWAISRVGNNQLGSHCAFRNCLTHRAREEMAKKGIDPDSPEAKLFGRKLLTALTNVFGRTILETGFFHADPHPGNLFVLDDGSIGLIDFGQVKQISGRNRETLAKVMIALDDRQSDDDPLDLEVIGNLALELGVELNDNAQDEA